MRPWRRWLLGQSCTILVWPCHWSIWPIACRSHDVDWLQYTAPSLPYHFRMGGVSDVLTRSVSSTGRFCANGKPIGDCIIPIYWLLFLPWDFYSSRNVLVNVRRWISEYHHCGPQARKSRCCLLRLAILTQMQIVLKARTLGTFPCWLVVWIWHLVFIFLTMYRF